MKDVARAFVTSLALIGPPPLSILSTPEIPIKLPS